MNFAIEVPGEANPLDFNSLCSTLAAATSNDHARRQAAGKQLAAWEQQPGYFSSLQHVYLDKTLPTDVRFLAVIQLKNGIDKYWRAPSQPKQVISVEEKVRIRERLFQGTVDEPDKTLALHNALVVAKIVRFEFPATWPEAIPSMIEMLRAHSRGDQQRLAGTLELLLRVTKELNSARLRRVQVAFHRVAPELLFVLCEIYSDRRAVWTDYLSSGRGDEVTEVSLAAHNSLLSLRVIRRLFVAIYDATSDDKTASQFWATSQSQFGQFLAFANQDSSMPAHYQDIIGKHLIQLTKFHVDMAQKHPFIFSTLPESLSLVRAYWDLVSNFAVVFDKSGGIRQGSADSGTSKAKVEGPLLERLALRGLLLLRACVKIAFQHVQTFKYQTSETKALQERARANVKTDLFKNDFVIQVVNCIITHLFVFRSADLEAWEEDPEEWEQQEQSEGNAYEWEVRPCAEKLFLDLLTNFKSLLVPPLLSYFQSGQDAQAEIATKEAVYTAMGLSASHVFTVFDFDAVLASTIVHDAQQQGRLYKVLRRRIAILISQWAPVKMTDASRPLVYQIFQHFLNPNDQSNDIVVRITAARQLRWIVDELGFQIEPFLPYTSDILAQLTELIQIVDVDETKLAILESVRILVTRMEDHGARFGDQLMSTLPAVWQNSGTEEYMIKQAVIAIFAALVMSMGSDAQRYQGFMVPLLAEAARPGSDLHLPLIDESLELWNAILMQSNAPLGAELVELAGLALPLLDYASETASQALSVVESYILMAPGAMLEDKLRSSTLSALSSAMDAKSRDQVRVATACVEYVIRSAAELGGSDGLSLVMQDMMTTGFLNKVLTNLQDVWDSRQTTGPNKRVSKLNVMTESDYFAILSRLALADPGLFVQMLSTVGELGQVWAWLSSEWFENSSSLDQLERQKLHLLGLTRLLELPSPMHELVLGKLQDYMVMWNTVMTDLQDGEPKGTDTLLRREPEDTEYDTPKTVREREMRDKDPVYSVRVFGFVGPRLQDLVARAGGEAAFEEKWAVNVDQDVLLEFKSIAQAAPF